MDMDFASMSPRPPSTASIPYSSGLNSWSTQADAYTPSMLMVVPSGSWRGVKLRDRREKGVDVPLLLLTSYSLFSDCLPLPSILLALATLCLIACTAWCDSSWLMFCFKKEVTSCPAQSMLRTAWGRE
jgi:hypothetical protein